MKLTLETARALQPGGRIKDHNLATKGLELRARGTVKSWHLYYVLNGRERRPKLGEFPAISIDEARRIAGDWRKRIARGEDLSAERQALRASPTVDDLLDHYFKHHAETTYRGTTLKHVQSLFKSYVRPELGKIRVAELSVSDVNRMLDRIAGGEITIDDHCTGKRRKCAPSKTNANRTCAYLSKALALAEGDDLKWRPRNSNPCQDENTRTFSEPKRRKFLEGDEFPRMFRALQSLAATQPDRVAAILCIVLAGSRVTEMATLPRSALEIDTLSGAVYAVLKDHKTIKTSGDHRLLIPSPAVKIMRSLPEHENGYVFGALAELASPRRAVWETWSQARELAGIRGDIQPRDLRRTFASAAKSNGASLEAIGELLRHENAQTTERYAFLFGDASRKLAEDTAGEISRRLLEPTQSTAAKE